MPVPPILVICPPPVLFTKCTIASKFAGAEQRCVGLAEAYHKICADLDCHYFDAGSVTPASLVDGIHLDQDQHLILGNALVTIVDSFMV